MKRAMAHLAWDVYCEKILLRVMSLSAEAPVAEAGM